MARRIPFFYGWIIVGISTVSGAFNTGLIVWGLGVFVSPMQSELGWSRTIIFLPLAVGAIGSSVLGPILGPYADKRHGPRLFFLIGVLVTGSSIMFLRDTQEIWGYLTIFGLLGGIGRYLLQFVMFIIPKWFVRRRGLAQAVNLAGMIGAGPLIFPVLLQGLIGDMGWRETWWLMGSALIVIGVPASFLIVRSPEDIGLRPDGESIEIAAKDTDGTHLRDDRHGEPSFTRREAMATRQFWIAILSVSLGMMGIRGIIPNFVPFFVDSGISPSAAVGAVSAYSISAIGAGFAWGIAGDRFGHRTPYIVACSGVALVLAVMMLTNDASMAYGMMFLLGLVLAGFWVLNMLLVANTFGRRHIGAIRGVMQPFNNAAMFGGPVIFAAVYDLTMTYTWLFVFAAGAFVTSAVSAIFLRPLVGRSYD